MPISCECPDCGKRLKAPDSAAGKKVTCPGCGSKISIPLPESADAEPPARPKSPPKRAKPARDPGDEFDFQNLDVDAGMEEIVEDRVPCPMCGEMIKPAASKCRHCGESLRGGGGGKRTKRRRSDSSMPVTIMVAIGIEGLFIALNALGIVGNLLQSNFPGACGSVVRIAIEVALLVGLIQRKSSARTAALVLSAIGL
ncbi:MAG: hypothetical protein JSS02_05225, partial [Planctomycetes bacterium]|nr:hypothetical protein [Planctomycetota bacterium]